MDRDPIYGVGDGNIVLDEASAAVYNRKKDLELNSNSLQKKEANRKKAVNKFNKKAQFINSQLEALGDDNDLGDYYPATTPKPTTGGRTNRTRSGKYTGGGNDNDTRSEY